MTIAGSSSSSRSQTPVYVPRQRRSFPGSCAEQSCRRVGPFNFWILTLGVSTSHNNFLSITPQQLASIRIRIHRLQAALRIPWLLASPRAACGWLHTSGLHTAPSHPSSYPGLRCSSRPYTQSVMDPSGPSASPLPPTRSPNPRRGKQPVNPQNHLTRHHQGLHLPQPTPHPPPPGHTAQPPLPLGPQPP